MSNGDRTTTVPSSGFAVAGYVLYTLSNVTGDLEALTWLFAVAVVHR